MIALEVPHVNVLTKMDMVTDKHRQQELQNYINPDPQYILEVLDARSTPKQHALNVRGFLGRFSPFLQLLGRLERISPAEKMSPSYVSPWPRADRTWNVHLFVPIIGLQVDPGHPPHLGEVPDFLWSVSPLLFLFWGPQRISPAEKCPPIPP